MWLVRLCSLTCMSASVLSSESIWRLIWASSAATSCFDGAWVFAAWTCCSTPEIWVCRPSMSDEETQPPAAGPCGPTRELGVGGPPMWDGETRPPAARAAARRPVGRRIVRRIRFIVQPSSDVRPAGHDHVGAAVLRPAALLVLGADRALAA